MSLREAAPTRCDRCGKDNPADIHTCSPQRTEPVQELTLESAPLGTKAPAYGGGHWIRVEHGWKWCTGSTFPRPGGDWNGKLIPPQRTESEPEQSLMEKVANKLFGDITIHVPDFCNPAPQPDDIALLRQALKALTWDGRDMNCVDSMETYQQHWDSTVTALRERLGEKA